MAAPIGNEYYKLRSTDGREKEYDSETLMQMANEYFEWCLTNPFKEEHLFHYQGSITSGEAKKMRPFTLEGFCNYAEIVLNTFKNYEKHKDFLTVTTRIRQIIDAQQLEGAASGFLNPNIIARKLGLVDRTDTTTDGQSLNLTPEERAAKIAAYKAKLNAK